MPFDITLNTLPAGYVMKSVRAGDKAEVVTRQFTSTEDGELFITLLEGLPSTIIRALPEEVDIRPSTVETLVAIIRRDRSATVYVNELQLVLKVRTKKTGPIEKGDAVYEDDIADVTNLEFQGLNVPEDCGIVIVFSKGWRKGFFYDLKPLSGDGQPRDYDLSATLAHLWTYLAFQHLFSLSDQEWASLLYQKWFPFVTLKTSTIRKILNYNKSGWSVDDLLSSVSEEVLEIAPHFVERWSNSSFLKPHIEFLEKAIERYQNRDYVSSISILFPRIEGIMRGLHSSSQSEKRITQTTLTETVANARNAAQGGASMLLPERFRDYLRNVFFASFSPDTPAPLSRHSVAHGVADEKAFSLKGATLGLLIVDQIFFHLPSESKDDS